MVIALITVEYQEYKTEDRQIPTVVLVGREVETRKKVMYRRVVRPYFYMEDDKNMNRQPNEVLHSFGVYKDEYCTVKTPWGRPLRKLYVVNPRKLEAMLHFLRKKPRQGKLRLYDVEMAQPKQLPLKFMMDTGIKSGFEVEGKQIKPVDAYCPLRIWILDVESRSTLLNTVNADRPEPIIMVTFWDSYTDEYVTIHTHSKGFQPLLPNHKVVQVEDEKALLLYLQECLDKKYDPDLIAAHNLFRYDLIKIMNRLKDNGLEENIFSPKPFRRVDRRSYPPRAEGRILCDMLEALKAYTLEEFPSYALESLVDELGLETPKVPFLASIEELWTDQVEVNLEELDERIRKYLEGVEDFRSSYIILIRNLLDVIAVKEYNEKFQLIDFYDTLRRELGGRFEDMLVHNRIVETGIRRMINKRIALPSFPRRKQKEKFRGAFVLEPEPGLYSNVAVLDFSREYPNIIQKLNISPETSVRVTPVIVDEEYVAELKKKGYHVVYVPEREEKQGKVTVRYPPQVYCFKKKPRGIIPRYIDKMFMLRDKFEEAERRAIERGDEEDANRNRIRAKVAKVGANASYGWMSWAGSPFYNRDCSAATALCGYLASQKLIEELSKLGYKAVYGDTDSIFYIMKPGETLADVERVNNILNERLAEWATKEWNIDESPFHLSVKRIYSKFLVLSKKRYGGKYVYHEKKGYTTGYEFKGLELVRSDSSKLEKEVQHRLFKFILDGEEEKIPKYWSKVRSRLNRGQYEPIEVAYPAAIVKRIEKRVHKGKEYCYPLGYPKVVPAHIRAVIYSNQYLGTDFRSGDKPRRLPIRTKLLEGYPKEVEILTSQGLIRREAKDIAIDEYYPLPDEFRRVIDWKRIRKRLEKKVQSILEKLKSKPISTELGSFFGGECDEQEEKESMSGKGTTS